MSPSKVVALLCLVAFACAVSSDVFDADSVVPEESDSLLEAELSPLSVVGMCLNKFAPKEAAALSSAFGKLKKFDNALAAKAAAALMKKVKQIMAGGKVAAAKLKGLYNKYGPLAKAAFNKEKAKLMLARKQAAADLKAAKAKAKAAQKKLLAAASAEEKKLAAAALAAAKQEVAEARKAYAAARAAVGQFLAKAKQRAAAKKQQANSPPGRRLLRHGKGKIN
jgi:hypothetical protein